jgi:transposase-like protein
MARREEWAKWIEQWTESGLTAAQFAQQIGVKESTLRHWKWQFDKLSRTQGLAPARPPRDEFVELIAPTGATSVTSAVINAPEPFELVLSNGSCHDNCVVG